MAKNKSNSQKKREASMASQPRDEDPSLVPDSGAMTTSTQLNGEEPDGTRKEDVNADEKKAQKKGLKVERVTVNLDRDVNLHIQGKDYVGRSFNDLTADEAEVLKTTVRDLYGVNAVV